jgi:hypothetical protein
MRLCDRLPKRSEAGFLTENKKTAVGFGCFRVLVIRRLFFSRAREKKVYKSLVRRLAKKRNRESRSKQRGQVVLLTEHGQAVLLE